MDKQKIDIIKLPQGKGVGFEILKNVTVAAVKVSLKKRLFDKYQNFCYTSRV